MEKKSDGQSSEKRDYEFCLRCGRKLKNPIARARGYGIICEKKLRKADTKKLFQVNMVRPE